MELQILYEDNHLISVYKPAGLLVQGDASGETNLLDEVKHFLKNREQKPGRAFVGLIHRLDRPVSGIVLFAKTSKGAARLSEQFQTHQVKKIYHAVVIGQPKLPQATLEHRLSKDAEAKKAFADPSGDLAILSYKTLASNGNFSLLHVELETGRFHQIRAQLSNIGNPIVGDIKYGAPGALPDHSIALSATELVFTTATTGEQVALSVEYPSEWHHWFK